MAKDRRLRAAIPKPRSNFVWYQAVALTLCAAVCLLLPACHRTVRIEYRPQHQLPASPDAWTKVKVGKVSEEPSFAARHLIPSVTDPYTSYSLSPSLSDAVRQAIERRIGTEGNRPVTLEVKNLSFAASQEGMGIRGDFYLRKKIRLTKKVRVLHLPLEHSVTARGFVSKRFEREDIYRRAVEDICDRLLYAPHALSFLGSDGEPAKDTALIEPDVHVGPVVEMKSSERDRKSTGRVLWAPGDAGLGRGIMVSLGDTKGALGTIAIDLGGSWYALRSSIMLGGFQVEDTTVFANTNFVATLFGHNGIAKDKAGYVLYPSASILLGPQILTMRFFTSEFEFGAVEGGGMLVLDVPLSRRFGFTAGYWGGVGLACVSGWGWTTRSICSDPVPLHSPVFDLWIRRGNNKFNLGLQFLFLTATGDLNWRDMYRNPSFGFTWTRAHGRGAGSQDTSLLLKGTELYGEHKDLSTPVNIFTLKK